MHLTRTHTHTTQKLSASRSWFPLYRLPSVLLGLWQCLWLPVQPWVSLQRGTVNRPSLPFLQRSSQLPLSNGPQFRSGHPCRGEVKSPPGQGAGTKGCGIQERKHCRQTPKSSSEFAARILPQGRERKPGNGYQAFLQRKPFPPGAACRRESPERALVSALCPEQFLGLEQLTGEAALHSKQESEASKWGKT